MTNDFLRGHKCFSNTYLQKNELLKSGGTVRQKPACLRTEFTAKSGVLQLFTGVHLCLHAKSYAPMLLLSADL